VDNKKTAVQRVRKAKIDHDSSLPRNTERRFWIKGLRWVAGVDEAGRGPLAGPVVAAACMIPEHVHFNGVDDSKKVKEEDRERLFNEITNHPEVHFKIVALSEKIIDEVNILQATMQAMTDAVNGLQQTPDHVLIGKCRRYKSSHLNQSFRWK